MAERNREARRDCETGVRETDENESVLREGETDPDKLGQNDQRWRDGSSRDPEIQGHPEKAEERP